MSCKGWSPTLAALGKLKRAWTQVLNNASLGISENELWEHLCLGTKPAGPVPVFYVSMWLTLHCCNLRKTSGCFVPVSVIMLTLPYLSLIRSETNILEVDSLGARVKSQILPSGIKAKEGNLSSRAKRVHLWRFLCLLSHLDSSSSWQIHYQALKPIFKALPLEMCCSSVCSSDMHTSTREQFSVITLVVRNSVASLELSTYG